MDNPNSMSEASRRVVSMVARSVSLALMMAGVSSGVFAKQAPTDANQGPTEPAASKAQDRHRPNSSLQEVVVTGTLLQGAKPIATSVISLGQAELNATGGNTIIAQLQTLPQVDNLGVSEASRTGTGGAANINYGTSINIRGLSPFATLTLLDGHRMPPAGTSGSTVDPNSFPSIMVKRIDIDANGASAIYGSDAIAGVANIILRRDVRGAEARVRYGWANGYSQRSIGVLFGHNWGSGQVTIGFENDFHTALSGLDRNFYRSNQTALGGLNYDVTQCSPGNIQIGGTSYAIPAGGVTPATQNLLVPGTMNLCDVAKYQDILPRVQHVDIAMTFDQRLSSRISLHGDATYAKRTILMKGAQSTGNLAVPTTNAYFVSPPGATLTPCSPAPGSPNCEQVGYWFGPDAGVQTASPGFSVNYQLTLGLNFKLGRGWRLDVSGTAGRDHDQSMTSNELNNGALSAALASSSPSTAYNVFGGANSPAVVHSVFNSLFYAPGYSGEQDANAKVTGPLFRMWGGRVRAAVGGVWEHDDLTYGINSGAPGQQLVIRRTLGRHSKGAYAEVLLPFVGHRNAMTGIQGLDLDAAVRYEDYSDFGSTTNPKVSIHWKPINSLTLSASYGTSFRAPLLSELVGPLNGVFVQNYSDPLSPTGSSVGYTLGGGNPALKPETATTYTLALKYNPNPRTHLSVDYFSIDYKNQISSYLSDLTILQQPAELGSLVTRCPSAACSALVDQYVLGVGPNATKEPVFGPILSNPSVFVNGLELNLGRTRADGFDFQGIYNQPISGYGIVSLGLSGSVFTRYDVQFTPAGTTFNEKNVIGFPPGFRMRGSVGWMFGPLNATMFVNYVNGYTNTETTPSQHVGAYTTVDLNAAYHFGYVSQSRWARHATVSVNVINIANTDPPYVNIPIGPNGGGGFDPNVGNPIGRIVSLEIQKRF